MEQPQFSTATKRPESFQADGVSGRTIVTTNTLNPRAKLEAQEAKEALKKFDQMEINSWVGFRKDQVTGLQNLWEAIHTTGVVILAEAAVISKIRAFLERQSQEYHIIQLMRTDEVSNGGFLGPAYFVFEEAQNQTDPNKLNAVFAESQEFPATIYHDILNQGDKFQAVLFLSVESIAAFKSANIEASRGATYFKNMVYDFNPPNSVAS
jgi:hypothetical protein